MKEKSWSKTIKTTLVALSNLAGASVGHAADKDGRSDSDTSDIWQRDQMVDPDTTGSIQGCDSGSYDEFGNCIVDPNMQ